MKHCISCRAPLRPLRAKASDYPDYKRHHSHGRCDACARADKRQEQAQRDTVNIQQVAASLDSYLAWRRPYRAKAGIQ